MRIFPYYISILLMISCSSEQANFISGLKNMKNSVNSLLESVVTNDLDIALDLAKGNRSELEKVLEHYKDNPEKLEAAKFLIRNMPGSYAADSIIERRYASFYLMYDSLSLIYNENFPKERGLTIDSLWENYGKNIGGHFSFNYTPDLNVINADQLIAEIELAFKSWKENIYTRQCSFEEFCEYILPYRRKNGIILNSHRHEFYTRHAPFYFKKEDVDFRNETDSLLFNYKHIKHSQFYGSNIPIWSPNVLEKLKYGLCEQRCWYNSTLLSSIGMAVTIDCVPAWGNRNSSHSWNALIVKGETYPFEPFWDNDRWKYKHIYNNESFDHYWGRFRLPKVYRVTYSNNLDGPILDKNVSQNDIPSLFKNSKMKDVSSAYFKTSDVIVDLSGSIPEGCEYAYLCVFGYQQWHPVQWGRIKNGKALFKDMGRDIVYLPVFYVNGSIKYASSPFLLNSKGKVDVLKYRIDKQSIAVKNIAGAREHESNIQNMNSLKNAIFIGSSNKNNLTNGDTLCKVKNIELYNCNYKVASANKYRYIRIALPTDTFALSNLKFYEKKNNKIDLVKGVSYLCSLNDNIDFETEKFVLDEYCDSGFKTYCPIKYVDFDLGKDCELESIVIKPYIKTQLFSGIWYELFYWDNGWCSLGSKEGNGSHLIYDNVPDGALFMVKNKKWKSNSAERIFIYKDGEILWY